MTLSMIAAIGKNNELGKNNDLIWHLDGDLPFFKKVTMGKPVIMGRNTYLSLPKALPGRQNIVLTFPPLFEAPGVTAVLPSCVWSSEWDVTEGRLNAWVHQRSCDVPLGLPFNVTQYATLLCMLAQVCGLQPGTLDWSIKDAHIYVNQIDPIKEQLRRFDENGSLPAPKLWLNPEVTDFFKFDNSKDLPDVKLIGYEHMGKLSFPIAQ